MKNKQRIKATAEGRRFSLEVPPIEKWLLNFEDGDDICAAKLKSGELLVVESFTDFEQAGWVARIWKDFNAIDKSGEYYPEFFRELARALGIKRMRWEGIWLEADDYLCDPPNTAEELRAFHLRRAEQLEAAGRAEQAQAFRKKVGLSATVQ